MSRIKGSKNKRGATLEGAVISGDGTKQPIEIVLTSPAKEILMPKHEVILAEKGVDLSAKILERVYHPEDFPHDCPDPREDRDGFLRWLSKQQAKGLA